MNNQPCFYALPKLSVDSEISQFVISNGFILKIENDYFYILDKKTSEIIKLKADYFTDSEKCVSKVKNVICYPHTTDIMKSDWYLSLGEY